MEEETGDAVADEEAEVSVEETEGAAASAEGTEEAAASAEGAEGAEVAAEDAEGRWNCCFIFSPIHGWYALHAIRAAYKRVLNLISPTAQSQPM